MSTNGDLTEYPNDNAKKILEKVVKDIGFQNFSIKLKLASEKGDNYLGVINRATVMGDRGKEKEVTLNLIIKTAPTFSREKMSIDKFYKREIYCYSTILPTLMQFQDDYQVPEAERFECVKVFASDGKPLEELLVMEDLAMSGYLMCDRQATLDFDHMILIVKNLARFHSLSFKLKQTNPEKFAEMAGSIYQGVEYTELFEYFLTMSLNKAINALEDGPYKDKVVDFKEVAYQKMMSFVLPELALPYTVLSHGDCWINNILFAYKDNKPTSLRLLDWQMVKQTSPVTDLAYLIFSSTDEFIRGKHYKEFLDVYYETLSSQLSKLDCDINECYPKDVYDKHLEVFMPFGLIMGSITAPLFMSEKDDVPDMDSILKMEEFNERDFDMKQDKSIKLFESRIRGIVKDIVDFKIL